MQDYPYKKIPTLNRQDIVLWKENKEEREEPKIVEIIKGVALLSKVV